MKKKISDENLVGDKNNTDFIEFVKYCRNLEFEENPDYEYLRGLMINCLSKNNNSIDNFYNIDINKISLFHCLEKKDKPKEGSYKNVSQNISAKITRCNSTKRLKINLSNKRLISNENDDYDNKIINESKSSSLGYIEKKVRNYSNFKNRGIKEIQRIMELKNNQNNNKKNYAQINKNKTNFKNSCNINNIKRISFENKRYSRSRFSYIKKSFGIEEKSGEMINNENLKKNIIDINNNENLNINNQDNDDGCIIL